MQNLSPYHHSSQVFVDSVVEKTDAQKKLGYYNTKYNSKIDYLDFRRNIITKGIKLNDLVNQKILIGKVEIEVIDLCRPCRFLQDKLKKDNIIKEFLRRGGLRCRILRSGSIKVGDLIK